MFAKITARAKPLEPFAAEALADLLYEIGKDLHSNKESYRASKWLENAYQTLVSHEVEALSPDAMELKYSIMHLLGSFEAHTTFLQQPTYCP